MKKKEAYKNYMRQSLEEAGGRMKLIKQEIVL